LGSLTTPRLPSLDDTKGDKMPGKKVKNWDQYHALRKQGKSKTSAAKITNAASKKKKKKG
jgi:hypothetical protein